MLSPHAEVTASTRPVALVGTTASGKSSVALAAARALGDLAICQVDSMCVYRGMDLATAKPSAAERAEVPHFLIDLVDPSDEFSVTDFKAAAAGALRDCKAKGLQPLLVGGTGLYHRAIIDDLEIPGQFPGARADIEERRQREGLSALYDDLAHRDPVAARRIDPANERRIVRALEVTIGSGRPFSSFGPGLESYPTSGIVQVGIPFVPDVVDAAIEARIATWRDQGLVDEVDFLMARPGGLSKTAAQALGYKEIIEALRGTCSLDEAFATISQRTKKLARRQWSWFKRDPRVHWITSDEDPTTVVLQVLRAERAPASVPD